jgi:hypothetical protein
MVVGLWCVSQSPVPRYPKDSVMAIAKLNPHATCVTGLVSGISRGVGQYGSDVALVVVPPNIEPSIFGKHKVVSKACRVV